MFEIDKNYQRPSTCDFKPYLYEEAQPPLDPERLSCEALAGSQRACLRMMTTGDWSLLLRYKGKEAHTTSFAEINDELSIVQFQGANGRVGYRLSAGFLVIKFIAGQIEQILKAPDLPFRRVSIPDIYDIEGSGGATPEGRKKYEQLACRLRLQYSNQERKYIRDLR